MKKTHNNPISRRVILKSAVSSAVAYNLFPAFLSAAEPMPVNRLIPSTGEEIPVIGMGSFITFDAGDDPSKLDQLTSVLQIFFEKNGRLIDTAASYGNAESVLGDALKNVSQKNKLFVATKVRIQGKDAGIKQMNESMQKLGVSVMDLMQVHNLIDWKVHLHTLRDWKEQGKVRYIGVTTSGTRDYQHKEFEHILRNEPVDFAQFTYNLEDRQMENRILPIIKDRGIATLINVPFGRGRLFNKVKGVELPDWAAEFDCNSWAQFFLKYIISHPQVTCVIPATSNPRHMSDNMAAGYGRLPDEDTRRKMELLYESL